MIIARGTPHGGSCLYTFAFVFEVKGGRVAASTLVYAALSLCLCLCPSYASAMPARHGCRKVPVAPHRVRGRLTHSPPGPSPPVPPSSRPSPPPASYSPPCADLSLSFHSSVSLRLPPSSLSAPSVSAIFFHLRLVPLCLCYTCDRDAVADSSFVPVKERANRI